MRSNQPVGHVGWGGWSYSVCGVRRRSGRVRDQAVESCICPLSSRPTRHLHSGFRAQISFAPLSTNAWFIQQGAPTAYGKPPPSCKARHRQVQNLSQPSCTVRNAEGLRSCAWEVIAKICRDPAGRSRLCALALGHIGDHLRQIEGLWSYNDIDSGCATADFAAFGLRNTSSNGKSSVHLRRGLFFLRRPISE